MFWSSLNDFQFSLLCRPSGVRRTDAILAAQDNLGFLTSLDALQCSLVTSAPEGFDPQQRC